MNKNWQTRFYSLAVVLHDDGAQGDSLRPLGPWACEAQVFWSQFAASWFIPRGGALEIILQADRRSQIGQQNGEPKLLESQFRIIPFHPKLAAM